MVFVLMNVHLIQTSFDGGRRRKRFPEPAADVFAQREPADRRDRFPERLLSPRAPCYTPGTEDSSNLLGSHTVKRPSNTIRMLVLALLIPWPAGSQDRDRPSSSEGSGRGVASGSSTGGGSASSRGIAAGQSIGSPPSASFGRDYGAARFGAGGGFTEALVNAPSLRGTSFISLNSYYQWQEFMFFVQTHYYLNSNYFRRFYRNTEPLITPELLKLTVRQPLRQSLDMVAEVDSLEALIRDLQAGGAVDKQALTAKARQIRELAKQIRQDESLAFFDLRRTKADLKADPLEDAGLEAVVQLREMALDLSTRLKNMYNQQSASTVSVQMLSEPSFGALSRRIEKLTKVIEDSIRRL
jgi:hypothetical protein